MLPSPEGRAPEAGADAWLAECIVALDLADFRGTDAALEYLIGARLEAFAERADSDAAYAAELPRFVARVRRLFPAEDIRDYFRATPGALATAAARLLLGPGDGSEPDALGSAA